MKEIMDAPQLSAVEKSKLYSDQLNRFLTFKNKMAHSSPGIPETSAQSIPQAPAEIPPQVPPIPVPAEIPPPVPATPKPNLFIYLALPTYTTPNRRGTAKTQAQLFPQLGRPSRLDRT